MPELSPALREQLDALAEPQILIEYLADRLGAGGAGSHWLRFFVRDGKFREGGVDHTRIGGSELGDLWQGRPPEKAAVD